MPKFRVWGAVVGSKYLGDFDAESKTALLEALDNGELYEPPSLCHQCSDEVEDPEINAYTIEEITGGPKDE